MLLDAFAVIRNAAVRGHNQDLSKSVALSARADRMVVGKESRARALNRGFAITTVKRALEREGLKARMNVDRVPGNREPRERLEWAFPELNDCYRAAPERKTLLKRVLQLLEGKC